MDLIERYNRGEFFSEDSIHFNDSLIYKTRNGRIVYGGGGIMPDIFISSDTVDMTKYTQEALSRGLIARYAMKYCDANRPVLSKLKTHEALTAHLNTKPIVEDFVSFADGKGLKPNAQQIAKSRKIIRRALYSNIIYQMAGMLEHVKYVNLDDPAVLKAIEVLDKGEAYPKAPDNN